MSSEDRIEILIEAENKASETIKTLVNDLKGVKTASSDVGTSAGLSKITEDLKALEAQVKATAKAMGTLAEQGGSRVSANNIKESIRAQSEAQAIVAKELAKPLKSSVVFTTVSEDPSFTKAKELLTKPLKSSMVFTTTTDDSNKAGLKAQSDYWNSYYKTQSKAQSDAAKEAKEAAKETQNYGSVLGDVGSLVQKAFASYLVYEFLSSLKDATSAVLNWMGNIETYGIAVAASLQVGGKYIDTITGKAVEGRAAFDLARRDSVAVIESLQVANFQTVATLDQLIRMYQEALPIAMKKGFDKKMVEEFTLSVTQAASAMGVSMDMMAEEARSLLTGAINMRNSRVAVALGITPDDVRQNSASADQLFSFLMGKLQVYRTAGEALQNSWRGLWSNFKDVMMQAGGKAFEPLFEGIKEQLRETVDSIVTLDKAAGKIIWNPEFLEGVNAIRDAIKDAWYYALLLKEVGSAGTGATKAVSDSGVGTVLNAVNPLKGIMNLFKGELPAVPGAIWDLMQGKGLDNRLTKGMSLEPFREFGKDRTTSATQFAARQAISESGMGERGFVDTKIQGAAKKYGVEPEDLAGIIYAESNFRNTMSEKDAKGKRAYGYMQLRESTAKGLGLDFADLMDPEKNIMTGTKYYKQLLDQFGGDREQAMMAYNKGPGFVQKYEAGEYANQDKTYKVYGKIQSAKDVEKNYAEGEAYYRKVATYSKEMSESRYYEGGGGDKVAFKAQVGMTEQNQKDWQEAYKKQIALAEVYHTKEIKEAETAGANIKQNLKNQFLSAEELKEEEAKVDEATLKQKLVADQKYLKSHQFFTDEMSNLRDKEGKGIYASHEDKSNADAKAAKEQAKIQQDISDRQVQLGTADAQTTQRANEQARAVTLEQSKEKLGVAQFEYDNLKKINDLKLSLQQITPTEAFESEYTSRMKVLEAQKESIELELQQNKGGTNRITLSQQLAKVNEELNDTERKNIELVTTGLKTDAIKQKNLEDLANARIAYKKLIADPDAAEALEREEAISRKLYDVHQAEALGLKDLAAAYRDIAKVMQESKDRGNFWGGITDGLDAVINSIGSARGQISKLVQGVGESMKSSLSDVLFAGWKGDLNFDKGGQIADADKKIGSINAQKEQIKLQQEQIKGNNDLSASEKETAQIALDAKLKQLEVEQQLAEAQKQAAENSKGAGDIWQGFLDSITKKVTDFMADSLIKDFFGFLSGEVKGKTESGGKGILSTFVDWIRGAKEEVKSGMGAMLETVEEGMTNTSNAVESGGSGIAGAFSTIFSGLASVAKGWMETIYKYVVDYLKEIIKSLSASGFGSLFGGGGGDVGGGSVGGDLPVGEFGELGGAWYHKGGSILRYHAGGLKRDEIPIVVQKGEYVLSKQDVDFVNKVKGGGPNVNVNVMGGGGGASKTTIVPLGVTVMVDNQSSALLQASAQARQSKDEEQYIIDVVMKNVNSRGALGRWR